jgi:hypothetical protein
MFIPNPGSEFFHSGSEFFPSRIRLKEFKYFNLKKWFVSTEKYDLGFIPDPDPDFLPIPDPGVKNAPDPRSGSATLPVLILNGQSREKFDKYNNNNESDIVLYGTFCMCAEVYSKFPDLTFTNVLNAGRMTVAV